MDEQKLPKETFKALDDLNKAIQLSGRTSEVWKDAVKYVGLTVTNPLFMESLSHLKKQSDQMQEAIKAFGRNGLVDEFTKTQKALSELSITLNIKEAMDSMKTFVVSQTLSEVPMLFTPERVLDIRPVRESREDTEEIKEKVDEIHKFIQQVQSKTEKNDLKVNEDSKPEAIRSITFVETKSVGESTFKFYVNENMDEIKSLRGDSQQNLLLIKIAQGENVPFKKELMDYINSNRKNTLYCKGKYKLSKIIKKQGKYLELIRGTKVRVVGEAGYKKKKNKSKGA